ncbi:MAG TPA: VanW family protein [Clostridiaceae bacterium]|nr:VanW family protein [Clostridiaceae bacterium]
MLKKLALLMIIFVLTGCASSNRLPEEDLPDAGKQLLGEQESTQIEPPPEPTVKPGVFLGEMDVGGMERSSVLHKIELHALDVDIKMINASINPETWEIYPEKAGKRVNVEKTLELVMNANEGEKVDYVIEEIPPEITSEMVKNNIVLIASYSTPLIDRTPSRVNNIKLAAKKINGIKLAPGEEFSFNRIVGRRTEGKGYELAPIIVNTEDGPEKGYGVGGGVCQVSTTIYNAVAKCGLKVTERHMHSKDINYVPEGKDATVSYGSVDFRFVNNRDHSIMIKVYLHNKKVIAEIYENRN